MGAYEEFDFDPRNLPVQLLEAIGLVSTNSAQTENVLKQTLTGLLDIDIEYGGAVTTHMTAPLRFDVIRAVAEIKLEEIDDLDELDILLDHCKLGFDERNAIVHNSWCMHPMTGETYIVKETARESYKMGLVPMEDTEVRMHADYIYWAGMDLWEFLIRMKLLPAFPPEGRFKDHKSKAARAKARKTRLGRASHKGRPVTRGNHKT